MEEQSYNSTWNIAQEYMRRIAHELDRFNKYHTGDGEIYQTETEEEKIRSMLSCIDILIIEVSPFITDNQLKELKEERNKITETKETEQLKGLLEINTKIRQYLKKHNMLVPRDRDPGKAVLG